jgi:transposase
MMQLHLDEISRNVAEGAHAVLLLDRAGWHTTGKLDVPRNITPIFLSSRAPELNPVENVWQYLRKNLLSNTVFENYDAIVDAACDAWRKLIAQPDRITSIGMRKWANVGLHPQRIRVQPWHNRDSRACDLGNDAPRLRETWLRGPQNSRQRVNCLRTPNVRLRHQVRGQFRGPIQRITG